MNENGKTKAFALIIFLLVIGVFLGFFLSYASIKRGEKLAEEKGLPFWKDKEKRFFSGIFIASTIIISVNILLLIGLLGVYVDTYAKTNSSFMLGLIFFIGVLLVQSVLSLPILHSLFKYTFYGLGIFGALPHLFMTFAIMILLILSLK